MGILEVNLDWVGRDGVGAGRGGMAIIDIGADEKLRCIGMALERRQTALELIEDCLFVLLMYHIENPRTAHRLVTMDLASTHYQLHRQSCSMRCFMLDLM